MRHNKLLLVVLGAFCLSATANAALIDNDLSGLPGISTMGPAPVPTGDPGPGDANRVVGTLDVAGLGAFSCDGPGAPCNLSVGVDFGSFLGAPGSDVQINGLGWDLTIDTVGASWLSEAVISFQSPAGSELFALTAGVGDSFPGTMFYSSGGVVDLTAALGFAPVVTGGILTIEFYESFDDVSGAIDAFYLDPSFLTFDVSLVVAEPAIVALFGFGLLGLAIARRRRS